VKRTLAKSSFVLLAGAVVACSSNTKSTPAPATPPSPTPVTKVPPTTKTAPPAKKPAFDYPKAKRGNVVDDYFGTKVSDPYRWLENTDSAETKAWVKAENAITFKFLGSIPARDKIRARLTKVWNYERYGTPYKKGGRYFYSYNSGLQAQSIVYWTRSLKAKPKVLLDPNTLSKDGTVALSGYSISDNGKYVAYGIARAGSDWQEWHVRNITTDKQLADKIEWVKFSSASWAHDSKGFYYSRYPKPKNAALRKANFNQKLYYHELGTPQSADKVIYERPDKPKWGFGGGVTDDGRYLIVSAWKGTGQKNLLYYKNLRGRRAKIKPLIDKWENNYSFIDNIGSRFYFFTDYKAPRGRIIAIDVRRPARKNWKEIISQSKDTLRSANIIRGKLYANYMTDAHSAIRIFNLRGKLLEQVKLPGIGSAGGFGGKRNATETFYSYTSFTTPAQIYRYDVRTGKSTLWRKPKVDFDGSKYEVQQVFYKSKDGTRVPMFITHKKGLKLDGQNPTYLYGYGGFNISLRPFFSIKLAVWLDTGGVVAIPNLRGGGEYGEEWHLAGTRLHKQNVFDDFIAAAEWLIKHKYTATPKLAIAGGSNGGLLIGACMTQRPELFGAALPAVGVMDMLRFHKFTIGWAWVDDYGSSDKREQFKALYAYSPYHNIKVGTHYPPTLITTADHDDRVVPGHSFKFAARLQYANRGDNPVLIRIQTRAGHGAGKPTKMRINEAADVFAFLVKVLDIKLP